MFGVRFLIQWLRSEQEGRRVIPIAFWYCSLVGGAITLAYAIHLGSVPFMLGQGTPLADSCRGNLYLIYRERRALDGAGNRDMKPA